MPESTVAQVRRQVERFLGSATPEVLCIVGKWGVGKTHLWKDWFEAAKNKENGIALPNYAYVSLFGRNSLDDARSAIVEARQPCRDVDRLWAPRKVTWEDGKALLMEFGQSVAGLAGKVGQNAPVIATSAGFVTRMAYLNLPQTIVCFDDLERRGKDMEVRGVLGLVTQLKEEKGCKVVLLLNQDMLAAGGDKDFQVQLEKVADRTVTLAPTPGELVDVVAKNDFPMRDRFAAYVVTLGISNARTIKKAETFCREMLDLLLGIDERVQQQAVHTLTLATFAKFQPGIAPSLELVRTYNLSSDLLGKAIERINQSTKDTELDDPNETHKALLDRYGYGYPDALDAILIDAVDHGCVDQTELLTQVEAKQSDLKTGDYKDAYVTALRAFSGGLSVHVPELLDNLESVVRQHFAVLTVGDVSQAYKALKDFGLDHRAADLLRFVVENYQGEPSHWDIDLGSTPFRIHPDVFAVWQGKAKQAEQPESLKTAILRYAPDARSVTEEGWQRLARVTADEYYTVFLQLEEGEARATQRLVRGLLEHRAEGARADAQIPIRAALRRIAAESREKAVLVTYWGYTEDTPEG